MIKHVIRGFLFVLIALRAIQVHSPAALSGH